MSACHAMPDDSTTTAITATTQKEVIQSTDIVEHTSARSLSLLGQLYDRNKTGSYKFKHDCFTLDKITFEYPQLDGSKDLVKEKNANLRISTFVMNCIFNRAEGNLQDIDCFEMTYRLGICTPDLISIVFEGLSQTGQGAVCEATYTLTFDVNSLRILKLSDFVVIDDIFVDKIFSSSSLICRNNTLSANQMQELVHNLWTKESILEYLIKQNKQPEFYVTPNSIVVCLSIISNQYVWVEIPLEEGSP
jgi:hypothetical protein